ncbi:MAG TPA: transketolase family protein, partial [Telluria sp.]|nr:transketolase family protein [Telluria sp.]
TILQQCRREGRLVVIAENHSIVGGLGEAIAMALLQARVFPVVRHVALPDKFLDAGALPTLHDRYGISTDAVADSIKSWLK